MKNREFFSHFKWSINFIQILNGGDWSIQVKMVTHKPCGNPLLNSSANKLENFDEMDGYLGKYILIINIILII